MRLETFKQRISKNFATNKIEPLVSSNLTTYSKDKSKLYQLLREASSNEYRYSVLEEWIGITAPAPPKIKTFPTLETSLEVPKNLRDIVVSVAPEKFLNEKGHIGTANGIADTGEWVGITFDIMNAEDNPPSFL